MKTLPLIFVLVALCAAGPLARSAETAGETAPSPENAPATSPAAPTVEAPPAPAVPPVTVAAPAVEEKKSAPAEESRRASREREKPVTRQLEVVFGETSLPAGESVRSAKVVFGQARIDGTVDGDGKFVFSDVTINGTVKGDIHAVFSQVILGPDAMIEGEVKSVFSQVQRHDGSPVSGGVGVGTGFHRPDVPESLYVWGEKAFCLGRPLAIDARLGWLWWGVAAVTALQLLLALIFPGAVEACGRTLTEHPGATLLSSVAVLFGTPLILFLLALTGVGVLLWPLVVALLMFAGVFGRTALQGVLGRPVSALFGEGVLKYPVVAVAIGALMLTACYLIPFLGFLVWLVAGWLALGMVAYAVVLNLRSRPKTMPVAAANAGVPVEPVPPPLVPPPAAETGDPAATPRTFLAMPVNVSSLPRAGFWLRLVASLVDAIIVGIVGAVAGTMGMGVYFPLLFAVYCVVLWALKGTTVGGIVFGLKVVRLDERKLDWPIALVRALGGFLSLFVAGLGFFWVAFDRECQSWHDKIAGTTVVRMPKGMSLL